MPEPSDTYVVLYSEGNDLDLIEVNQKAAEGWELVEFFVAKGEKRPQARFAYVMKKPSTVTPGTDILIGTFTAGASTNRIILSGHGLSAGTQVRFTLGPEPSNALPTPLSVGAYYFVLDPRSTDFQVALTPGGAFIDLTSNGAGTTNQVWKKA